MDLVQGPRLRRGVRAGSLRDPEPRAREKTKKWICKKKTIYIYLVAIYSGVGCNGVFNTGYRRTITVEKAGNNQLQYIDTLIQ